MRKCKICGVPKPLTIENFALYHVEGRTGHIRTCRDCANAKGRIRDRKRYHENTNGRRDKVRHLTNQRWHATPTEQRTEKQRRYRANHPLKNAARWKVREAIKAGKLIRQSCFCGSAAEAHHDDYAQPLVVLWLCKEHHAQRHRMLYRAEVEALAS